MDATTRTLAVLAVVAAVGCGGTDTPSTGTPSTGTPSTGTTTVAPPATDAPAPSPTAPDPDPVSTRLDPRTTGEGITGDFGDHLVAFPAGVPRGELLVWFPGTGGQPDDYEEFLLHAASLGYHVIGLAYPNAASINFVVCGATADPDCPGSARDEVLFGLDAPGLELDVPAEDAAVTRLVAALVTLSEQHPDGGWSAFLDGVGDPVWADIVTAGHSQGGGHAAFLAAEYELARTVLVGATEPAAWTSAPSATPAERHWALAHVEEPSIRAIQRSWEQLGIPGPVTDIEASPAPWGGSQRLVTSTDRCGGDPTSRGFHHNCAIVDDDLPQPITTELRSAWTQLLTG